MVLVMVSTSTVSIQKNHFIQQNQYIHQIHFIHQINSLYSTKQDGMDGDGENCVDLQNGSPK